MPNNMPRIPPRQPLIISDVPPAPKIQDELPEVTARTLSYQMMVEAGGDLARHLKIPALDGVKILLAVGEVFVDRFKRGKCCSIPRVGVWHFTRSPRPPVPPPEFAVPVTKGGLISRSWIIPDPQMVAAGEWPMRMRLRYKADTLATRYYRDNAHWAGTLREQLTVIRQTKRSRLALSVFTHDGRRPVFTGSNRRIRQALAAAHTGSGPGSHYTSGGNDLQSSVNVVADRVRAQWKADREASKAKKKK